MRILKFNYFVTEALGVPQNIIPLAKQVFDYFIKNIDPNDGFIEVVNKLITMKGNFKISDMDVNQIELAFRFKVLNPQFAKKVPKNHIDFVSMQSNFKSAFGPSKKKGNYKIKSIPGKELFIGIVLEITEDVGGKHIIDFFTSQRNYFVPIIAHELKHFYDKFKNPDKEIQSWVDYSASTKIGFSSISSLREFSILSYYLHDFENLVRPTEFAAMLDIDAVGEKDFKTYFEKSDVYLFLKKGREFSLENLKKGLIKEKKAVTSFLLNNGYFAFGLSEEELLDSILKLFYEQLLITKGKIMDAMLHPFGKPPFRFMGKKQLFYDKYLNQLIKFGDDYEEFFRHEEEYINSQAEKMFRKLSGLYAMTDIYGKKEIKTDIWKR